MDGISGIPHTTPAAGIGSTRNLALSQEEFFQIMISEMQNQDPLEPLDNQQFLSQLTQMQTMETMTRLSEGLESLLLGQQISSAGILIGKTVHGEVSGVPVQGTVERVVVEGQQVFLGVGEVLLPLSGVQEVLPGGQE